VNIDIQSLIDAGKAGGEVLKKYFGQSLEMTQKTNLADFRTKADTESESAILEVLTSRFPNYNILSEEVGQIEKGSEFTFAIDPLDGTNNFVLGIPNFSISIALLHQKTLFAGVVYAPMIDRVYSAVKDKGAYFDGHKLFVSKEENINNVTLAYSCSYQKYQTSTPLLTEKFYRAEGKRILSNWSPAFDFCMLASGRLEAIIYDGAEIPDFAAGKLLAREAGAMITDFEGREETDERNNYFIASNNRKIHEELLGVINAQSYSNSTQKFGKGNPFLRN
jgi:myo-inositol-1(or 4)-monophosphatase